MTKPNADSLLRIYVACLSSYNAGELHGAWFDVADYGDAEELGEAIREEVLATSKHKPAEEYAIHDTENNVGNLIGEYSSLEEVVRLSQLIEEYGDVAAAAADTVSDLDGLESACSDRFMGATEGTLADYLEEQAEECGDLENVPAYIRHNIDWEGVARDAMCDYDAVRLDGLTYIFTTG